MNVSDASISSGDELVGATKSSTAETASSSKQLVVAATGEKVSLGAPDILNWPAVATAFKFESLKIQLDVEVAWPSGHCEAASLALEAQMGAQVFLGGSLQDGQRWTPLMVSGERTINVSASESTSASSSRPCNNIMRAVCQHTSELDPSGCEDSDSECDGAAELIHSDSFTVTGGKTGLAGVESANGPTVVATGFFMRIRLNVTATVYLSRAAISEGSHHTLVVNSTGTLELRPKVTELRRLPPARTAAAAQDDAKNGDHTSALQKWRAVLPSQEKLAKAGGREKLKLASILHSMGVSYNSIGNGREALSVLRRALAIRQQMHGEEHPDSARTLQAIGVVRVRDGEYHEAFEYFWQALRYYEAFEPESLDAASTLQAVAGVYGKLGEYSEALECYLRVVSIRERELDKDHLDVATTHHNLGVVFEKLSEHTEALESLHQALAVREKKLGPSHPQTARTLHSIGIVYSQLLDYQAALTYYQRALDICQNQLGEGTHAAATLNNMGVVYAKLGHTENAVEHHQHALSIQEKILGPNHADTVATRYNLHVLMMELDQNQKNSVLDHVKKAFMTTNCATADKNQQRKSKLTPSLFSLLCEENEEIDGPADEPCCCCECCRCASTARTMLHKEDGLPVITRDQKPPAPARLGFPEPKKRGKAYPAAPHNTSSIASPPDAIGRTPAMSHSRRAEDWSDCKNCKLSL